jgi:hypothetical protein
VFEAPRDASSLAVRWLDSCQRRCEPSHEAVCIGKSDTSRDTPSRGGVDVTSMRAEGNPLERGPRDVDMQLQGAAAGVERPSAYLSESLTRLEFEPPSESFAFTLSTSVPAPAEVFGVSLAVHVVEVTLVIVTFR